MNIRWTRTVSIKNSRVMEAIAWSKELCGYVEKKHGVKVDTWLDVVGKTNTIRWSVDHADVASFDKVMTGVNMDPDYWKFVDKAMKAELFIDGSGIDVLSKKL